MALQLDTTLRTAIAQALGTTFGAAGLINVRTGSPTGVTAVTGTLLATLTALTFAAAATGAISISATADSSGDATGTPGHVDFVDSGAVMRMQADAAVGSGTANFSAGVSLGGTVSLTSGSFTAGNA